jgi:hypothetical protein
MSPLIRNNVNLGSPNPSKLTTQVNCGYNKSSEFVKEQEEEITAPTVFFIDEDNLAKCPQVDIVFSNGTRVRAILDSGSAVNLLSESVYCRLVK